MSLPVINCLLYPICSSPHGLLPGDSGDHPRGVASFKLAEADPFGVVTFTLPQDVDFAQQQAAYDQWKSSARVIIGSPAMTLIPLLVSGGCGVFGHWSLPFSVLAALLRMIGVASFLLVVSSFGSRAIDRILGSGESSALQAPYAIRHARLRSPLHLAGGTVIVDGDAPPITSRSPCTFRGRET